MRSERRILHDNHTTLCHQFSSSSSVLEGGEKGSLPVVATVFDKLNQVYKEYLDAEQNYTVVRDDLFLHRQTSVFINDASIYVNYQSIKGKTRISDQTVVFIYLR